MRPPKINEIANRAAHASPGPWKYYYPADCYREERTADGWIHHGRNADTEVPPEDWIDGLCGRITLRGAEHTVTTTYSEPYTTYYRIVYDMEMGSGIDAENVANAEFIASAREDIPALLEYITTLEKQLEEHHDNTKD